MKRRSHAMVVSLYGLLVVAACGGHTAPHQTEGAHSDTTISPSLDPLTVEDILVMNRQSRTGGAESARCDPRGLSEISCANKAGRTSSTPAWASVISTCAPG
jgi:hypothetical protein